MDTRDDLELDDFGDDEGILVPEDEMFRLCMWARHNDARVAHYRAKIVNELLHGELVSYLKH